MVLILCKDFEVIHSNLPAIENAKPAVINISGANHVDVDMLKAIVYSDGIVIQLAVGTSVNTFQYGNVYFITGNDNQLLRIQVSNMSEEEIHHTIRELSYV